mgnify:CR=1 FL=1
MSWTDLKSIEHIKQIRDLFNVKFFIETGTFLGMNVLAHKDNFKCIRSCEINEEYYNKVLNKCKNYKNIIIDNMTF